MGVIRTDQWLDEHFFSPTHICSLVNPNPNEKDGTRFYHYLRGFGMYEPSIITKRMLDQLKEQQAWEKVEQYFQTYRQRWNGPDVDIYIFPIQPTSQFMRYLKGRSGVAFPNKIFLFLSPTSDIKNWESIFIHEYHHATRMRKYDRKLEDYNLLDSLIFEGMAEHAVLKYCGKKYTSEWMTSYGKDELKHFWKHHYKPQIEVKKKEPVHDILLLGKKGIPRLMGYAIGAELIKGYKGKEKLTMQDSFMIPSETIYKENTMND